MYLPLSNLAQRLRGAALAVGRGWMEHWWDQMWIAVLSQSGETKTEYCVCVCFVAAWMWMSMLIGLLFVYTFLRICNSLCGCRHLCKDIYISVCLVVKLYIVHNAPPPMLPRKISAIYDIFDWYSRNVVQGKNQLCWSWNEKQNLLRSVVSYCVELSASRLMYSECVMPPVVSSDITLQHQNPGWIELRSKKHSQAHSEVIWVF